VREGACLVLRIIGPIQALETIKLIVGVGRRWWTLLLFDARKLQFRELALTKDRVPRVRTHRR